MSMWHELWAFSQKACYKNKWHYLIDFSNNIVIAIRMYITVAAILEVGPDDVFLREAENAKSASTHGGIYGDPRVSH